ncbi:MAG: hypothetical protein K6L76_01930 [Agarilytica sp.]
MMRKLSISLAISGCFLLHSFPLYAEDVRLPVGASTQAYHGALPSRGLSKDQVEQQFGSPDSKNGPSGQPPIYFWEYPNFTVYFESDYVLHAVLKNLK